MFEIRPSCIETVTHTPEMSSDNSRQWLMLGTTEDVLFTFSSSLFFAYVGLEVLTNGLKGNDGELLIPYRYVKDPVNAVKSNTRRDVQKPLLVDEVEMVLGLRRVVGSSLEFRMG